MFTKVIKYAIQEKISYEVDGKKLTLCTDDFTLVVVPKGSGCCVGIISDRVGCDGSVQELGTMTQNDVIGVIMGALVLHGDRNELKMVANG